MSASPHRPAQPVAQITGGPSKQCREQVLELVAGHRDQSRRVRVASAFGNGRHDQEGVCEHGKGDPAVTGAPAADLVLVQAAQALAGLEALFHRPAPPGDPDQDGQRGGAGRGAAVGGQLAGLVVAADHEPVLACLLTRRRAVVVEAQECPVVVAVAFGALAARHLLPCPRRDLPEQGVGTAGDAAEAHMVIAGDRQHVADPSGFQFGPQPGVGAVDIVAGPLAPFADGLRRDLAGQGYALDTVGDHVHLFADLSDWLAGSGWAAADLTTEVAEEFLRERRAAGRRVGVTTRAIAPILGYLRRLQVAPPHAAAVLATLRDLLLAEYRHHLEGERGLSAGTVTHYLRCARVFLTWLPEPLVESLPALSAGQVTDYVLAGPDPGGARRWTP